MKVSEAAPLSAAQAAFDWFRIMADAAPVMIWFSGPDKQSIYFNERWLEFTGRTLDQELGDGWAEIVHPDDRERCLATYGEAFDARREFEIEARARRHDGVYRWHLNRGTPIHARDGTFVGYIGTCIDVTERRNAEQERQLQLVARLVRLREERDADERKRLLDEERRRIAGDLHERVEQALFAIGLAATAALGVAGAATGAQLPGLLDSMIDALSDVTELAATGAEQLRAAIHTLNSVEVVGRGLVGALSKQVREFRLRTGIEADIVVTGSDEPLQTDVAETLFATVREALANVERHSHAGAVMLGLHISPASVTLSIQDDGRGAAAPWGADVEDPSGLRVVATRVLGLNGTFAAGPAPDGGFLVRTQLPLGVGASR
ncbi:MAG: PAS domain S-box protein [Chloroflexi bacterium]|nr:MAG: PAS domain S-box protein [Chloroflexota bacterium]